MEIGDFLPGKLLLERGVAQDYRSLQRFHYRGQRPATFAAVWRIVYIENPDQIQNPKFKIKNIVAVGVLSWPTLNCHTREKVFGLENVSPPDRARFVNQNIRTISRVIVHPQFRGIGLAAELVRTLCIQAGTPYVEALAAMGRAHPFFQKGGMRQIESNEKKVSYYLWEKM